MNEHTPQTTSYFPVTRWSLVLRATGTKDAGAVKALGELLKSYWTPLQSYARRSGLDDSDAEDAVQSFCESLIHRESLRTADRVQGRLRSFLLASFQNHLRSLHRDRSRQKRGGGAEVVSLDDAGPLLEGHMASAESPDHIFDRQWAHTLLERVMQRLRDEYAGRGKQEAFAVLEPALVWNGKAMSYEAMAAKLGLNATAVAQAVKRMRGRFRALLDAEIADTVEGPDAVAEERLHLIRVLSGQ